MQKTTTRQPNSEITVKIEKKMRKTYLNMTGGVRPKITQKI